MLAHQYRPECARRRQITAYNDVTSRALFGLWLIAWLSYVRTSLENRNNIVGR